MAFHLKNELRCLRTKYDCEYSSARVDDWTDELVITASNDVSLSMAS